MNINGKVYVPEEQIEAYRQKAKERKEQADFLTAILKCVLPCNYSAYAEIDKRLNEIMNGKHHSANWKSVTDFLSDIGYEDQINQVTRLELENRHLTQELATAKGEMKKLSRNLARSKGKMSVSEKAAAKRIIKFLQALAEDDDNDVAGDPQ